MSLISSLVIGLSAKTDTLQKDLGKAEAITGGFVDKIKGAGVAVAAAVAGFVALKSVVDNLSASAQRIDELGASAVKLGVGVEALAALQFAAGQSDVEVGTLQNGLQKLNATLGDAVTNGGKSAEAFEKLGLSAASLAKMGSVEAIKTIADRINAIDNPAQRARAAMDLFGKSGQELLPLLSAGSDGIEKLTSRASELGLILSEDQVQGVKTANDAVAELSASWSGMFDSIMATIAPVVTVVTNAVTAIFVAFKKSFSLIYQVVSSVLGGIAKALKPFTDIFGGAISWIADLFDGFFGGVIQGFVDMFNWVARKFGMDEITNPFAEAANNVAKDTFSMTTEIEEFAEVTAEKVDEVKAKFDDLSKTWQTQIDTVGMTGREIEIFKLKALGATDEQIKQLEALNQKLNEQEAAEKRIAELKQHDETINKWQEQVDTIGLAGRELEIYQAKMKGATDEQIAQMEKLNKKLTEQEELKKLNEEGKALTDSLATPLEKYEKELKRLDELRSKGAIDSQTFERAKAKAFGDLDSASGTSGLGASTKLAGAADFGSVEALQILHGAAMQTGTAGADPMTRLAEIQTKELEESKKQTRLLQGLQGGSGSSGSTIL